MLKSGVPNAITVFREMKEQGIQSKNYGIRLDSGDLAYLSIEARKMLNAAGFTDAKIVVSNSLDEFTIRSLLQQGAQIGSFGIGERMITARSEPVFGAVYKLCAVEEDGEMKPRIKISENIEKVTNPGLKEVYRAYDENGHSVADIIAEKDEDIAAVPYLVDPGKIWKKYDTAQFSFRKLQEMQLLGGERVHPAEDLQTIRARVRAQMDREVWDEEKRFENPHGHYLDMTPAYYDMKMNLLSAGGR